MSAQTIKHTQHNKRTQQKQRKNLFLPTLERWRKHTAVLSSLLTCAHIHIHARGGKAGRHALFVSYFEEVDVVITIIVRMFVYVCVCVWYFNNNNKHQTQNTNNEQNTNLIEPLSLS